MRENPATLGQAGAAALQDVLYRRVTVRTEEQLTVVETETKGGLTRRLTMAPDEIDREFAVNGLDEHFHHNVMGGERLREAARRAATAARRRELRWETGQMVPALRAAGRPHCADEARACCVELHEDARCIARHRFHDDTGREPAQLDAR